MVHLGLAVAAEEVQHGFAVVGDAVFEVGGVGILTAVEVKEVVEIADDGGFG